MAHTPVNLRPPEKRCFGYAHLAASLGYCHAQLGFTQSIGDPLTRELRLLRQQKLYYCQLEPCQKAHSKRTYLPG